jgi:hypothetical protein
MNLLEGEADGRRFTVGGAPLDLPALGATVPLCMAAERLHWSDPATGQRL